jgi:hypothetical protein
MASREVVVTLKVENLPEVKAALEQLRKERDEALALVEVWRPVVEAAKAYVERHGSFLRMLRESEPDDVLAEAERHRLVAAVDVSDIRAEALQEARKQARIHGYGPNSVNAVVFAAGWQVGIAEGRRLAAADIRNGAADIARSAEVEAGTPGASDDHPFVLGCEWAAQIAEGTAS